MVWVHAKTTAISMEALRNRGLPTMLVLCYKDLSLRIRELFH